MSEQQYTRPPDDAPAAEGYTSAGAQLRAARESHGLSIDTVAQHLKLAPRQVRAIEDGDFSQLPGRTFIRGFARNYARLMRLDPEANRRGASRCRRRACARQAGHRLVGARDGRAADVAAISRRRLVALGDPARDRRTGRRSCRLRGHAQGLAARGGQGAFGQACADRPDRSANRGRNAAAESARRRRREQHASACRRANPRGRRCDTGGQ